MLFVLFGALATIIVAAMILFFMRICCVGEAEDEEPELTDNPPDEDEPRITGGGLKTQSKQKPIEERRNIIKNKSIKYINQMQILYDQIRQNIIPERDLTSLEFILKENQSTQLLNTLHPENPAFTYAGKVLFFSLECQFIQGFQLLFQQDLKLTDADCLYIIYWILKSDDSDHNVTLMQMVYDYRRRIYECDVKKIYRLNVDSAEESWIDKIVKFQKSRDLTFSQAKLGLNWVLDNFPEKYFYASDCTNSKIMLPQLICQGNLGLLSEFCRHKNTDLQFNEIDDKRATLLHFCFLGTIKIKIENRLARIKILLENGADINTVDIWGFTPLMYLFVDLDEIEKEKGHTRISIQESIHIFSAVIQMCDVSLLTLMMVFFYFITYFKEIYSVEETREVATLILDYCSEKYRGIDLRRLKVHGDCDLDAKTKIFMASLKTTVEKQNDLLEIEEPIIVATRKKKRKKKQKKKKVVNIESKHNVQKQTETNFDCEKRFSSEKSKFLIEKETVVEEKTDEDSKINDFNENQYATEITNLKRQNENLKSQFQQQQQNLEYHKSINLIFEKESNVQKNTIKDLTMQNQQLKKKLKETQFETHSCLQARFLVENIFSYKFPEFYVTGDLYQSIQNLKQTSKFKTLCNSLEFCRKAGNTVCHFETRLKYEQQIRTGNQTNFNEQNIRCVFWSISRELPNFTPQFNSSLWNSH